MVLGIPVAIVFIFIALIGATTLLLPSRMHRSLLLVLGSAFWIQGLDFLFFVSIGDAFDMTVVDALLGFALLGVPFGLLCFSLARLHHVLPEGGCSCFRQYSLCVGLQIAGILITPIPLGAIAGRVSGAVMACVYAVRNKRRGAEGPHV